MSYQSEILADGPAIYLRNDMVGLANNGDAIPDISGNDLHPTLAYSDGVPGSIEPYGHPSAVETDPDSREVRLYNAGELVANHGATISRASDSLIEPPGNFTLKGIYRPSTLGVSLISKRQVFDGSCFGLGIDSNGRFVGHVVDTAETLWSVTAPGAGWQEELLQGDPWFVDVVRVGNILQIWVQGILRAQTTIASGLGTLVDAGPLLIGAGISGPWSCHYDEIALFTSALGGDRLLTQYEAAFFNNPLAGRADLHLIATLDGTEEPTPRLFPFSHNWEAEVREDLAWLTDIIPAAQDYEQAAGIRQRPLRSFEYDFAILDNRERRRLHAFLFQNHRRPVYARLETETVQLTAAAAAGAGSLAFVSTHYDFDDGTLLALIGDDDNFEILEIDTVGATSTTLAGVTANAWPKGTPVLPIRRALMESQLDYQRHTDALEDHSITFRIFAQDVALAPRRNGTYTPRYTYKSLEVFDPFILGTPNWNETGRGKIEVRTIDPDSPAGIFSRNPLDTASREIVSYSFFLDSRADIARFLAWLWSIQGRRVPLWVPTLQRDFDPISTAGSSPATLTVEGHDYTEFFETHPARSDLVLVYANETMIPKRISSAAAAGANDVLTIEQAGALSLASLTAVSFLKLSRLNEDTIGLVWHTNQLLEVTLNFIDLLTT